MAVVSLNKHAVTQLIRALKIGAHRHDVLLVVCIWQRHTLNDSLDVTLFTLRYVLVKSRPSCLVVVQDDPLTRGQLTRQPPVSLAW